jgi:hypothetical protein
MWGRAQPIRCEERMHRILAIFRKDARHLWPQISVLLALMAVAAVLDPAYTSHRLGFYELLPGLLLPLACWTLLIGAIHQESLTGDRQYWLTRPLAWKELLAAKALFVIAFINLPLLVCHVAVYRAVGVPVGDHWAALFWRQVFFTAVYLLPAAAVASITRNLGQVAGAALATCLAVWLTGLLFQLLARRGAMEWDAANASMTGAAAVTAATGAALILAFQYSRRRTRLARGLAAGIVLGTFVFTAFGPRVFGRERAAGQDPATQILLDRDPGRHSSMTQSLDREVLTLDIPVRLSSVPEGVILDQQRTYVYLEEREWFFAGGLHDFSGDRAWLNLFVERGTVDWTQTVTLYGSLYLKRYRLPRVLPLPRAGRVTVPGVGVCRDRLDPEGTISFACYSPSPRESVMIYGSGTGVNWIIPQGFVESSIPTAAGFPPLVRYPSQLSYGTREQAGDAHLVAAEPLPPARAEFRLAGIRLADYIVGPQ